jgi:hypothetical protein
VGNYCPPLKKMAAKTTIPVQFVPKKKKKKNIINFFGYYFILFGDTTE